MAGIVDIILLIVEFLLNRIVVSSSAEEEIAVKNLIEVLENLSEEFIKDPNFLVKGMMAATAGYFGKRYGSTSDDYEKAYYAGEDLVLAIDIILAVVTVVRAIPKAGQKLPKFTR